MKVIYSGLESSGKSLRLAMEAERILKRNSKWRKRTGIVRPIFSNMTFSLAFSNHATELGIPLNLWENLDELIELSDCDVFIDEIGTYFDSRTWTNLSLDVRRWIAQAAKRGVEIYGAAQDFAQVDIAFRRLVNELYFIKKMLGSNRPSNTRPPVKNIWGVCMVRTLDPRDYSEEDAGFKNASPIPSFFLIQRKHCEIFDTGQIIRRSVPIAWKHLTRPACPDCGYDKDSHQ